jgi:predicted nucleotidyltransferase component of viral defense system
MDNKLTEMLSRYPTGTILEKENALKEVSQEIILYGLSLTDFFSKAAMYGGTAMRLFLGLDRFSEDLDFVIKKENTDFSWEDYASAIKKALASFGLTGEIVIKEKNNATSVSSAILAEPTKDTMAAIFPHDSASAKVIFNQKTKIKFEVSLISNSQAHYQTGYLEYPTSIGISCLDSSSLFSGKICAILYRNWKSRSKGRDFYDFAFYVRRGIKPNLYYLQEEIKRKEGMSINPSGEEITARLKKRFAEIDFAEAKNDVLPFIRDASRLDVWCADYFSQLTDKAFTGQ